VVFSFFLISGEKDRVGGVGFFNCIIIVFLNSIKYNRTEVVYPRSSQTYEGSSCAEGCNHTH